MAEEIDDVGFVAIANIARDGAGEAGGEDERVGTGCGGCVAVASEGVVGGIEISGDANVIGAGGGEGVGEEGFGCGGFAGGRGVVVYRQLISGGVEEAEEGIECGGGWSGVDGEGEC